MKKSRVRLIIIVITILIICAAAFFMHKKNGSNKKKSIKQEAEPIWMDAVFSDVCYGSLESSYSGTGVVSSDEGEICDIFIFEGATGEDINKINALKGHEFTTGDVIYAIGENQEIAKDEGKIVQTETEGSRITIYYLNYSKLYVTTYVPYDLYGMMGYDCEAVIRVDDQNIDADIIYIGYLYDEDGIEVRLACNQYIMPNREIDVEIKLDATDEMLFISDIGLQDLGGYTFVYVVTDEEKFLTRQVEVEVGRTLTVYENGHPFVYYEILSGLTAGQELSSIPLNDADNYV